MCKAQTGVGSNNDAYSSIMYIIFVCLRAQIVQPHMKWSAALSDVHYQQICTDRICKQLRSIFWP